MEKNLVLKAVWDNGRCSFLPSYSGISSAERDEVLDLADGVGFVRANGIWSPSEDREIILNFRKAMSIAGYGLTYVYDSKDAPFDLQRLNLRQGTRARLEALPEFELENFSGWAPVQAEGTTDGRYFYFRARGSYWRFEFGGNRSGTRSARWWYEELWPTDTGFGAGYLTDDEAISCILKAVEIHRSSDRGRFRPGHADFERTVLDGWSKGALSLRHVTRRLRISGEEAVRRTREYELELPYTADLELKALKKGRYSLRRVVDQMGVWVRSVSEEEDEKRDAWAIE